MSAPHSCFEQDLWCGSGLGLACWSGRGDQTKELLPHFWNFMIHHSDDAKFSHHLRLQNSGRALGVRNQPAQEKKNPKLVVKKSAIQYVWSGIKGGTPWIARFVCDDLGLVVSSK